MEVLWEALDRLDRGERLVLVTIIATSGSTPRHPGARMLVGPTGQVAGTVGGGRIEQELVLAGQRVAAGAPAERVLHHLVRDLAMCCGGSMEALIAAVAPSRAALSDARTAWCERRPVELVLPLDGSAMQVQAILEPVRRAPRLEVGRFVLPVWPSDRVVLFGYGHLARALVPLLGRLGFEVVVCDDNETGALDLEPEGPVRVVDSFELAEVERALGPLGPGDSVVILTRDHSIDQRILEACLPRTELGFLGLIGSQGKVGRFRKRLEAKGVATAERWARLRAPIGLDIAAETPAEIAVSIAAELIKRRRSGDG